MQIYTVKILGQESPSVFVMQFTGQSMHVTGEYNAISCNAITVENTKKRINT